MYRLPESPIHPRTSLREHVGVAGGADEQRCGQAAYGVQNAFEHFAFMAEPWGAEAQHHDGGVGGLFGECGGEVVGAQNTDFGLNARSGDEAA
ncbi:MAG: hypothetical protein ACI82G_001972, partial [Bradymonadia bacterium]